MDELEQNAMQQSESSGPSHLLQIDVLKGLAIVSVLLWHTVPQGIMLRLFGEFYIYQAVNIFIILLGVNMGMSFARRRYGSLKDGYSKAYFMARFERIVYPVILIFLVSLIIAFIFLGITGQNVVYIGPFNLIGYLAIPGYGNFFISILLQFIVISPLLYRFYQINPNIMIICCFFANLVYDLVAILVFHAASSTYSIYYVCILRWIFAIALGIWISEDYALFSARNRFILIGAGISIIYLIAGLLTNAPAFFDGLESLSFFYPLLLILIGMRYFPTTARHWYTSSIAFLGRASYHIFLVQIIFFPLFSLGVLFKLFGVTAFGYSVRTMLAVFTVVLGNIAICVAGGLCFMYGANYLWRKLFASHFNHLRTDLNN